VVSAVAFLKDKAAKTEQAMAAFCDAWRNVPPALREAIRYSLFTPGKRLRPALVLGASEIVCGDDAPAIPAACAIEMIHCYSLIHDDLPAMDNDDLRRGKPTLHKAHGEAMAILAGDALATMAFEFAVQCNDIRIVREIAEAAGPEGMAGGQVIDLESEGKTISLDALRHLHSMKTGALIRASVRCGAMIAGADDAELAPLTAFGEHIGLAFQIADDILDVVGSEEALGKPIGSDAANAKSTYPAVVGLERARVLADESADAAIAALELLGPKADVFRALARYIVERDK
jgi:geranylgeranyl diphosphate synthase type II